METVIVISDTPAEKILAPKPRRLNHKKKSYKRIKTSYKMVSHQINLLNDLKGGITKEINLDSISLDEMDKDFKILEEKTEEEICYNELSNILSSSSEDFSTDSKHKKENEIKRPKKPTERNVLFFSQNSFSNEQL